MPIFRHIAHHVTFFNLSWLQSELEEYEKCHSYDSDCYRKNVRARKICDSWGTEISDRFQATGAGEYASRPATPVPGVLVLMNGASRVRFGVLGVTMIYSLSSLLQST